MFYSTCHETLVGAVVLLHLQGIPRTLRSMYMHAWQSWLWNRAASERYRRYGAEKAVAGDLVLLTSEQQQQQQQQQDEASAVAAEAGTAAAAAVDALYEAAEQDGKTAADNAAGIEDEVDAASGAASAAGRLSSVHIVTEAEAATGKFSVRDVVLPLPGGRVQYPQHEAGWQLYCRMASADGVMLPGMTADEFAIAVAEVAAAAKVADHADSAAAAAPAADAAGAAASAAAAAAAAPASHGAKDFQLAALSGDYRRLLHVPEDMQHQVIRCALMHNFFLRKLQGCSVACTCKMIEMLCQGICSTK
jgi:membrane protein involved in colicin uptake